MRKLHVLLANPGPADSIRDEDGGAEAEKVARSSVVIAVTVGNTRGSLVNKHESIM